MEGPRILASLPRSARRPVTILMAATFITLAFGLVPIWLAELNAELGWPRWTSAPGRFFGVVLFLSSFGLVLYCSGLFARIGKGTPVPIDPPTELVVAGLYRYSRNPMYFGQVGILLSYFVYSGELMLLLWCFAWTVFVVAFVILVEEPGLRARFGESYEDYCREAPRWLAWGGKP